MLLVKPLVSLFLAAEYGASARFVPLLVFGILCGGCANFLDSIYRLRLSTSPSFLTALVAATSNLLLNFLLIPRMGVLGAAFSTALSYGALFVLRLWHTKRLLSFDRLGGSLFFCLTALFAGAVSLGVERYSLGILLVLLSLLPIAGHLYVAGVFFCHRALVLIKSLQKKKKYGKNF